jgi:hypothetical protein
MALTIRNRASTEGRSTLIYEFFDARVLGRLWFVAISDGASVQLMVPTFHSERAARIFERCLVEEPSTQLLTMDGQLELARRIEKRLQVEPNRDPELSELQKSLPVEEGQMACSGA